MCENTNEKLMKYHIDKATKEASSSAKASCLFCGQKILDTERYCVRNKYDSNSCKYIHIGCFDEATTIYREKMTSLKAKHVDDMVAILEKNSKLNLDQNIIDIWESDDSDIFISNEHGYLKIPPGWDFLPAGNPFLTKTIKKLGPHWTLKDKITLSSKRNQKKIVYTTLGIWAPLSNIEEAEDKQEQTHIERLKKRDKAAVSRGKNEIKYLQTFHNEVLKFLNFADAHKELAQDIADSTAATACEKSSGRVGRTGKLSMDEKVKLATIACIRHNYTNYESELIDKLPGTCGPNDESYREIKKNANSDAYDFIRKHQR